MSLVNASNSVRAGLLTALLIFLLAPLPALFSFVSHGYTHFHQTLTPESVLFACGYGMRHPHEIIAPLYAFLSGEARNLDCADLGQLANLGEASLFSHLQPWFTWSAALLWRLFGLDYLSLLPLVWLLYGAYLTGVYALAAQFLHRRLALAVALVLSLAPLAVGMSAYARDFSKGAFFIWGMVLVIRAIRHTDLRASLAFAGMAGAVIGLGYGFRADLLMFLPAAGLALAVGVRAERGGPAYLRRLASLVVPATLALAYMVIAAPVWSQINVGGFGGTFAMQGATEPFRMATGREAAAYTLGWAYSDELTLSGVAAAMRLRDPNWDEREQAGQPITGISAALTQSTAHLTSWADIFAADFVAQGLKSSGWVIGLPAFVARVPDLPQLASPEQLHALSPTRLAARAYDQIGRRCFVWVACGAVVLLLFRRYLDSPREALALVVLFGVLTVYPGIQFAARHVFHLEALWVIALLAVPTKTWFRLATWRRARSFFGYGLGIAGTLSVCYGAAILWQTWALGQEVERLVRGAQEPIQNVAMKASDGSRFFLVPVPEAYRSLTDGPADSLVPASRFRGIRWDVRAAADRLLVQVGGPDCDYKSLRLETRYAHKPDTWQPFDAEWRLLRPPLSGRASFLVPAFYRPTQHFEGIWLPADAADCTVAISRLTGPSRLPFVFTATLDGTRMLGPRHQFIGGFGAQVDTSTITARIDRRGAWPAAH
jgi:hypothetical protein